MVLLVSFLLQPIKNDRGIEKVVMLGVTQPELLKFCPSFEICILIQT